jgi:CRISPR-associated protein Csd1
MDDVSCFPTQLKLDEQGCFALGYYQQRQDFFKKTDTETIEESKNGN